MRVLDIGPSLGELLDRQQDLAARHQLRSAGVDDMAVYRRIRAGAWQRVLPGVYLVVPGPLSVERRRIAASLFTGPEAQLTGLTVLHWYGFKYAPSTDRVQVLVPHRVRCRSSGFVTVQRALSMDEYQRDAGLYSVTSPARAVVDACRASTERRDVRAIVAEAVHGGFTTIAALDEEIRRAARSRTALVRRALAEVVDGVRSSPEAELREITLTSKVLPRIAWNPPLVSPDGTTLPTPDGWIAEVGLALEVDSREHHSSPDGWRETLHRHNRLSQYGVLVLHITPAEIRREPRRVLAMIEHAYLNRLESEVHVEVLTRDPS